MRRLLYTFSFILLLLAIFLGLWWQQSYTKDLAMLRDQVESEMNQLVSDEFVFPTLQAVMQNEPRATGSVYWLKGIYGGHERRIKVERGRLDFGGQPRMDITIIGGEGPALSSHFYYDKRRFALNELPMMVRDSMLRKFGIVLREIAPPRRPGIASAAAAPKVETLVSVKHIDRAAGSYPKATFAIENYGGPILLGLLPEFLFGVILFGATVFAFVSAYRSLREQKEQLRAKDVLVANVAHELKTPIATVGVALEALNLFGADADPSRRQEYLAIGQSELQRLDAMANRAIDSMQDGNLASRLKLSNVDLREGIDEAWRGLALRYDLPPEALSLSIYGDTIAAVDEHYWYHLVYNLLDNACKYGGRPLHVDVNISGHAGEKVLTVTDNGPGIPPAERRNVFERFYRIYRPKDGHKVKGHGLGLSFVRQIARAHGGEVEVDNAAAGGARFTVRLPG